MKTLPKKNDVLFAHKALNIMPGLGDSGRRVAGALIDHFNKKDGRCYPSVERLCKLLGLNRATILRATKTLHDRKIIAKVSHGGPYHQANYQPNWAYLRGIVKDWDSKMRAPLQHSATDASRKTADATAFTHKQRPKMRTCDSEHSAPAAQYHAFNQSDENVNEGAGHASQSVSHWPINGNRSPSRKAVSRIVAQKRWEMDAMSLGENSYGAIVEWVTDAHQEAATDAELKTKGGGLRYIVAAMADERISHSL